MRGNVETRLRKLDEQGLDDLTLEATMLCARGNLSQIVVNEEPGAGGDVASMGVARLTYEAAEARRVASCRFGARLVRALIEDEPKAALDKPTVAWVRETLPVAKADARPTDRKLDYRGRSGEQVLKPGTGDRKPGGADRPGMGDDCHGPGILDERRQRGLDACAEILEALAAGRTVPGEIGGRERPEVRHLR